MKYLKRLKMCRKLYSRNIRKVGRIYISKNRRYFITYYRNSDQKVITYARYKMEKKLGRLLKSYEDTHHKNENTLNDKYWNLKIKIHGKHMKDHKLGKHRSEETKRKISISHIGKIISEETKRKMSISKLGSKNNMYGKTHSKEVKKKLSLLHKGNKYWLGKHHNEESKKKLRDFQFNLGMKRNEELAKKFGQPWS